MISFVKATALTLLLLVGSAEGFAPVSRSTATRKLTASVPVAAEQGSIMTQTFTLSPEEIKPIFKIGEGEKQKVVNTFGLVTLAISLVTGPFWMLAMTIVDKVCNMNEELDPNRAVFDYTGKIWSRVWLTLSNSFPEVSGEVDALKEGQGPCLYVANHASWLDIPVLCTVLDPVFKFIAKAELKDVPCIGQQLTGVSTFSV
jgi:1-acyl-sn-glycerol-3-phosphate acyltransferase